MGTGGTVTRTLTKAVPFFPDWKRVLERAAEVRTVPVSRRCYLCGSDEAELVQMVNTDEWKCADATDGCGRRLRRRG